MGGGVECQVLVTSCLYISLSLGCPRQALRVLSQGRGLSREVVLEDILWAFIANIQRNLVKLTLD